MVSVAIIGQRHSEEFWFGPGLHVTRLATMKGKHHGGVYPATVSVSVGYNFFSPICLFMVFVITLWQVSQAGQEVMVARQTLLSILKQLVARSLSLEGFRNQWRLNETAISAHSGDN